MVQLTVKNLHVNIEGKEILKGLNLDIPAGEIHAIMGPNGTGKSTLASTIMGDPKFEVTQGDILLDGQSILELEVDERARLGLFQTMQYPTEIPGVTNADFIRGAIEARRSDEEKGSLVAFYRQFAKELAEKMNFLDMKPEMAQRSLNQGFSGGEKKRNEILQMMMIKPKIAMLDEIDSGLDIDALRVVSKGVNAMRSDDFSALVITHYQRLLNYIKPDVIHVMMDGRIVKTGGPDLALKLEAEGYVGLRDELGLEIELTDEGE
ncbi:Fe-S cluster assembly ATPase SufC [Ligilactobacillus equi]|nr:Fe-S cluster assembly ATPase SufC [Ligilactobacillus equi]KRL83234.1 ABC superfamily ATP binding cassette transporter, ABC protein [Ligilactobacillus equi DSM 15833 = JCM 10991]